MQVSRLATPLTREQTAARFLPAYRAVFGADPDRNRAELLLALAWLENANGQAFIRYNWGNLSTKPLETVAYWRPPWWDLAEVEALPDGANKSRLLDVHARMLSGSAPEAFRAFDSHEQGLSAWLELLKRRPQILDAASSGDATRFAHAIFETRYCPDKECRDAGPSYGRLRDQIATAGYFKALHSSRSSSGAGVAIGFGVLFGGVAVWAFSARARRFQA